MFDSLFKAVLSVVTIPVSAIADVVTLGGSLTDKKTSYTEEAVSDLVKNLNNATKPGI